MDLEKLNSIANMMEENEAIFEEGFFTMEGPTEDNFQRILRACKT